MAEFDADRWLSSVTAYGRSLSERHGGHHGRRLSAVVLSKPGEAPRKFERTTDAARAIGVTSGAVSYARRSGSRVRGWTVTQA